MLELKDDVSTGGPLAEARGSVGNRAATVRETVLGEKPQGAAGFVDAAVAEAFAEFEGGGEALAGERATTASQFSVGVFRA